MGCVPSPPEKSLQLPHMLFIFFIIIIYIYLYIYIYFANKTVVSQPYCFIFRFLAFILSICSLCNFFLFKTLLESQSNRSQTGILEGKGAQVLFKHAFMFPKVLVNDSDAEGLFKCFVVIFREETVYSVPQSLSSCQHPQHKS